MAYDTEVKSDYIRYLVTVEHTPSGIRTDLELNLYKLSGTPSESQRDNLFQAFLDHIADLPNCTIVSSQKTGKYTAQVTVTP